MFSVITFANICITKYVAAHLLIHDHQYWKVLASIFILFVLDK